MRLAVFDFITHFGGAQRSTTEAIARLKDTGCEVLFIDAYDINEAHRRWCSDFDVPKISLVPNPKYPVIGAKSNKLLRMIRFMLASGELMKVVRKLKAELENFSPDYILTYTPKALDIVCKTGYANNIAAKQLYWCRGEAVPPVINRRNQDIKIFKYFCLSQTTRRTSVANGYDESKIAVVSNAIDIDDLNEKAARPLQSPIDIPSDSIKILVSATLLPTKGQACAIKALGRLFKQNISAELLLAGDCGNDGDDYLQQLKSLAAECGVAEHVHFLGWRNDVAALLAKSDILLLPTHSEGMPRSVMEAMALKKAVVATPVGSIAEMLDDGKAGSLFPIDDDEILAEKLSSFIENPQLRSDCESKAFEICTSRYSAKNQVQSFFDALKS